MKLTKNFKEVEFITSKWYKKEKVEDKVAEDYQANQEAQANIKILAENLQVLRDYLNTPISINIAYRPLWWEEMNGRSGTSQHCLGKAADIRVRGLTPEVVAHTIKKLIDQGKMHNGGLGIYPKANFVHYDTRPTPARWKK